MSDNVFTFRPQLVGDGYTVNPDEVLQECIGTFKEVVVVGIDNDGRLVGHGSGGRPEAITLLERAKARLLASYDD